MKKLINVIIISLGLFLTAPSFAQIGFHIYIGPPAPRHEIIVERPYPEAVWVPGYYMYDPVAGDYLWISGRWQRPPFEGAEWVAPRYYRHGSEFRHEGGRWRHHGER
jgi:hypothetical protein